MPSYILVVDDERYIARLIQVNLERVGYEVITAFDGKEALVKVVAEKPDLVVMDVEMPGMDGLEVLQYIRKLPTTRELPIIMLTPSRPNADVYHGWLPGLDFHLRKPVNPMELIALVRNIFVDLGYDEDVYKLVNYIDLP